MTRRNPGRRIGRKIGRNFGRNFLGIFVLHWLCRTTHQNFSPNSSQFITPCLGTAPVIEISKFHLRELLGLGMPNTLHYGCIKNRFRNLKSNIIRSTGKASDFSRKPWRNLPPTWVIHMAARRPAHNAPIQMTCGSAW